jgi:hypothetical protein
MAPKHRLSRCPEGGSDGEGLSVGTGGTGGVVGGPVALGVDDGAVLPLGKLARSFTDGEGE